MGGLLFKIKLKKGCQPTSICATGIIDVRDPRRQRLRGSRLRGSQSLSVKFFLHHFNHVGLKYLTPRAAGLGLEPRYPPPEGDVLPLDDPAALGAKLI